MELNCEFVSGESVFHPSQRIEVSLERLCHADIEQHNVHPFCKTASIGDSVESFCLEYLCQNLCRRVGAFQVIPVNGSGERFADVAPDVLVDFVRWWILREDTGTTYWYGGTRIPARTWLFSFIFESSAAGYQRRGIVPEF